MSDTSEALLRMNGELVARSLRAGRTAQRISKLDTNAGRIDAVFLNVLGRHPRQQEQARLRQPLDSNNQDAIVDLMWALMQTTEFQSY